MLKASAFLCTNPRRLVFGLVDGLAMRLARGWVSGFRVAFGWPGVGYSTESLILAQDERWRRA